MNIKKHGFFNFPLGKNKKLISVLVLFALSLFFCSSVYGWGAYTHTQIALESKNAAEQKMSEFGYNFDEEAYKTGAIAPDMFFVNPLLSDIGNKIFHDVYFSKFMVNKAVYKKDGKLISFALGWLTHTQSDITFSVESGTEIGVNLNVGTSLRMDLDGITYYDSRTQISDFARFITGNQGVKYLIKESVEEYSDHSICLGYTTGCLENEAINYETIVLTPLSLYVKGLTLFNVTTIKDNYISNLGYCSKLLDPSLPESYCDKIIVDKKVGYVHDTYKSRSTEDSKKIINALYSGNLQAVEGFSSIIGSSNNGNYNTYRGQGIMSYWEYAGGSEYVEWKTSVVPASYNDGKVTFIWTGSNGIFYGKHDLYLDGKKLFTFNSNQARDKAWTKGEIELFFDYKNNNADRAGVYYLTVPVDYVKPGQAATIKVIGTEDGGRYDWFMLHSFTDTITYETNAGQLRTDHIGRANNNVCVPKTCQQLGKQCGMWDNGCGAQINCGSCPTGQICQSDGSCKIPTSNLQSVEGFSSIIGSSNQWNYNNYRGTAIQSYWEYAGSNQFVEWKTASVPSSYNTGRVTFIFTGSNGYANGGHDIYLNGNKLLTFNSNQAEDKAWVNGDVELFFDFKNHNSDNAGVYYLTVPVSRLVSGQQTIKVIGTTNGGGLDWFMLHSFTDTITYETNNGGLRTDHIGTSNGGAQTCSDGTAYGQCSIIGGSCGGRLYRLCADVSTPSECQKAYEYYATDKKYIQCMWNSVYNFCQWSGECQLGSSQPQYCNNGNLVYDCSMCGCPSGKVCQSNGICGTTSQTCSDGTSYGQCSATKPQYCDNGNLINKCGTCGCPSGQTCQVDGSCKLPTQTCSDGTVYGHCSSTKPKYCDNGNLIDKCQTCGCPSGQSCDTNTGKCCKNDCSTNGARQCSGSNTYQTCGNYDTDPCLEWSTSTSCPTGKICKDGQCVTPCPDICHPYAPNTRLTGGYSPAPTNCPGRIVNGCCYTKTNCPNGQTCKNAACAAVSTCADMKVTGPKYSEGTCTSGNHCVGKLRLSGNYGLNCASGQSCYAIDQCFFSGCTTCAVKCSGGACRIR